jgi:hypothetical protein
MRGLSKPDTEVTDTFPTFETAWQPAWQWLAERFGCAEHQQ